MHCEQHSVLVMLSLCIHANKFRRINKVLASQSFHGSISPVVVYASLYDTKSFPQSSHLDRFRMLCTYPVSPSFVHVCIYFGFPLWLFLELDSLLWNIGLEVSGPFYNLITRSYATNFNMNFLEVSLLL